MNNGNLAKYLRHGAPPRRAHQEDKTTNVGGSHHVVEEIVGVMKMSGKYLPPAMEVLPVREKKQTT